jgi:dihydrolipoamide dehydrogenase
MHSKGAIQTDEYMRTSVKDIFAIGDVNGKSMLAHTASAEGTVAIKNILGEKAIMNYRAIPQCVYTTPEIAWLGLTEKEALERATKTGAKIKTGVFPMAGNGKSLVDGDVSGSIKIIADEDNRLIGAHLVCEHASDMITELGLMMNTDLLVQEIVETVHPHPTFSEAIMEAAEAVIGKPVHI